MCEMCLQNPCHPRCPHAPDPPKYGECENCGVTIYDGDECYKIGECLFCISCVREGFITAEVSHE